jgi:hypothetical protein
MGTIALFAIPTLLSAFLLFWLQLLVGKLVLPLLGGVPMVWNTCLVFFQLVLLLSYGYTYALTKYLSPRWQVVLHLGLLTVPLGFLPIALPSAPEPTGQPILWLLGLLLGLSGAAASATATTAPLLQRWFSYLGRDPYFLYVASNVGSLAGLLSYPVLLEPNLPLNLQGQVWQWLYWAWLAAIALCGYLVWGSKPEAGISTAIAPDHRQRLRWLGLAFLPSSLLVGVTTYISTDLAAVPLLWVLPLAIYLATYIAAFSDRPIFRFPLVIAPALIAGLVIVALLGILRPVVTMVSLHLLGLGTISYLCHRELAQQKPPAAGLTEFYWWLSLGGALGGVWQALLAPLLFSQVQEYPLMLALAWLILPALRDQVIPSWRSSVPISLGLLLATGAFGWNPRLGGWGGIALAVVVLVGLGYGFALSRVRLSVGLILIFLIGQFNFSPGRVITIARSFFGVHRVVSQGPHLALLHGTTIHGRQGPDREPLTYFHRTGPIGQLFQLLPKPRRVAVLGLGIGTLAAYAQPGQAWDFYEIDPEVERLARQYFSFLADSPAQNQVILGDGRLGLSKAADRYYDLLIMDAFSSDAIPSHLLTLEAMQTYQRKLTPNGAIVVNISNRFVDMEPVLAAAASRLGLRAYAQMETIDRRTAPRGKSSSHWVVMTNQVIADQRWRQLPGGDRLWTDDFSNLWRVLRWGGFGD